ncbi:MAG: type VI secretion system baseplate subunit TssG [Planctomycetaceae bacterium]|nr:MAG: type VI secretion system baseplate subunit TssG [Planctomycetaceae bacterium]
MAGDHRETGAAVDFYQRLRAEPYRFGFQLTLRRLDCLHLDRAPLGLAVRPRDEPVRIGQFPGLDFAPANLHSCRLTDDRLQLRFRFLGLFGPNGPLPLHLTEYARDRMRRNRDDTLIDFLDVFHHRILSLFYRAWAFGQPTVQLDRPDTDRFSAYVGALAGLIDEPFFQRDELPDHAKLHYCAMLNGQARNAAGLEAMLADFFAMPCQVEQFVGHWMRLPTDCTTRFGYAPASATLGDSAICGDRVWDVQSKFRLVFGPLDFDQFRRLLPGRDSLRRLIALIRNYLGDEWLWDIRLRLKKEQIPSIELGRQGQLGWTTFLISKPPEADSDAAVFAPEY